METGAANPNGGGEDAMLSFLLLLAVAAGGCWFLWDKFHPQISTYVIAAQHWEMVFISRFTDRYAVLDQQAQALDPSTLSFKTLYKLCHLVGLFFRIPAALLIGVLALWCLTRNAPSRFTTVYTTDTLARAQARVFRTTAAFATRQLRPVGLGDAELRPLDPALHVREWIERYARASGGAFDAAGARRELTQQLGPVWSGPEKAPALVRCLLAAFALHASRERDGAQTFLGDFSEAMAPPGKEGPEGPVRALPVPEAVLARADAILAGHDVQPYLACADGHAFTAPALMSVLTEARQRAGVLAPAQFNFIKLIDRRLWYALHALGFPGEEGAERSVMPNPRIEAAGARDHWAAERMEGRPLLIPSLDRAMAGIRLVAENIQPSSRRKAHD